MASQPTEKLLMPHTSSTSISHRPPRARAASWDSAVAPLSFTPTSRPPGSPVVFIFKMYCFYHFLSSSKAPCLAHRAAASPGPAPTCPVA